MAELQKIDVVVGTGAEARPGMVKVHYTGWLHDPAQPDGHGKKFDSSYDRGEPISFPVGQGRVRNPGQLVQGLLPVLPGLGLEMAARPEEVQIVPGVTSFTAAACRSVGGMDASAGCSVRTTNGSATRLCAIGISSGNERASSGGRLKSGYWPTGQAPASGTS